MKVAMPAAVGVQFTHAVVQTLATSAGIDVLHIKGPALHPDLCPTGAADDHDGPAADNGRHSGDADILVRPSEADRLLRVLAEHRWRLDYPFEDGSNFRHAATMEHPTLAPVDVHRLFPGLGEDAERAFECLWESRQSAHIAGVSCWVPELTAQRLILLVNAARGGLVDTDDVDVAWTTASAPDRGAVEDLARQLGAEVPLAAATGRLAEYADRRDHDLWRPGGGRAVACGHARRVVSRGPRSPQRRAGGHPADPPADRTGSGPARSPADGLGPGAPDRAARSLGPQGGAACRARGLSRRQGARVTYAVPEDVAWVEDSSSSDPTVYLLVLPDGEPRALHGSSAVIWLAAISGSEDVVVDVSGVIADPPPDLAQRVTAFVAELLAGGLLKEA